MSLGSPSQLERPTSIDAYISWLRIQHNLEPIQVLRSYYSSITAIARAQLQASQIAASLNNTLTASSAEYEMATGYPLFPTPTSLSIEVKSFDSFLLKTFRKNVLNNAAWPSPPTGGWLLPNSCHSDINDILRSRVAVKYLDGVVFLLKRLQSHCTGKQVACDYNLEARMEGYYAGHLYSWHTFEVPGRSWNTYPLRLRYELQVTTQLQEVIVKLLHRYYENRRLRGEQEYLSWEWDHQCEEFSANYLGHILHYVEGMIVEIREKQRTTK